MQHETIHKNGKTFVLLPMDEYKQLQEQAADHADLALFDSAMARGEESFPLRLFDRIDVGEHPVRVFRDYRNMTQAALASATGLTHSFISQIEARKKNPSLSVLKALAQALRVDVDMLTF